MENLMKVCTKCKVEKSVEEFYKNKSIKDGMSSGCKSCRKQKNAKYYKANVEKCKEIGAKYYKANVEKCKESDAKWRKANIEKVRKMNNKWRKANPEKVKEYDDKWNKANPEKLKERCVKYRKDIGNGYIKRMLKQQNFPQELINNPEFIEVKRLIIKTQRLCKTSQI